MKILLLGHTGFIGHHIMEYFRVLSPQTNLVALSFPDIDLCRSDGVEEAAQYFTSDTSVIMCAGIKSQLGDSLTSFRKNLSMIENVGESLRHKAVHQFVYFSSAAVYGEDIHNLSISEETPVQARTFYGIAKYASERLLWKVMAGHKEGRLAVLRPPLVYGDGDESKGYGPAGFLDKLLRDEEIVLWGDGGELREFVNAQDVARIVYEIVCRDFTGVLNPASGRSYSFRTVLDLLETLTGKKARITHRERTKEKVDNVFSTESFRNAFPDFRFTPLEEGLRGLVEAARRDGTV